MTDVYEQARSANAYVGPNLAEPADLFESYRKDIFRSRRFFGGFEPSGKPLQEMVYRLKLLVSLLEEINRVHAYRLRIEHAVENKLSLHDLETATQSAVKEAQMQQPANNAVFTNVLATAME